MPALNPRITEGSDLVRDTTPDPQALAQDVLFDLTMMRGSIEGMIENSDDTTNGKYVLGRVLERVKSVERKMQPLAYPRHTMGEVGR